LRTARKWLLRVAVVGSVVGGLAIPASLASAAPAPASPVLTAPSSGSSLAEIQKQIKVQSAALEKIVEQYDGVNTTLAKNQATEATMQKQMAPTLALLDTARKQVGSIAAVAYMDGGSLSTMSAFVSSSSTQDLASRMTLLSQVASLRQDEIANYQRLTATYQADKQKLDALIAAENAQKKSLATQKATINTKLASLYKLRTQQFASGGTVPARTRRQGGRVRVRPTRQAVPVGRRRTGIVRLLRSGRGGLPHGRCLVAAQRRDAVSRDQPYQ
jgi:septal ring factor EnvC (AmiA/AmiB activator)